MNRRSVDSTPRTRRHFLGLSRARHQRIRTDELFRPPARFKHRSLWGFGRSAQKTISLRSLAGRSTRLILQQEVFAVSARARLCRSSSGFSTAPTKAEKRIENRASTLWKFAQIIA